MSERDRPKGWPYPAGWRWPPPRVTEESLFALWSAVPDGEDAMWQAIGRPRSYPLSGQMEVFILNHRGLIQYDRTTQRWIRTTPERAAIPAAGTCTAIVGSYTAKDPRRCRQRVYYGEPFCQQHGEAIAADPEGWLERDGCMWPKWRLVVVEKAKGETWAQATARVREECRAKPDTRPEADPDA